MQVTEQMLVAYAVKHSLSEDPGTASIAFESPNTEEKNDIQDFLYVPKNSISKYGITLQRTKKAGEPWNAQYSAEFSETEVPSSIQKKFNKLNGTDSYLVLLQPVSKIAQSVKFDISDFILSCFREQSGWQIIKLVITHTVAFSAVVAAMTIFVWYKVITRWYFRGERSAHFPHDCRETVLHILKEEYGMAPIPKHTTPPFSTYVISPS